MSEASEISNQEKLMGTWKILGESIGCGVMMAFVGFALPIFGAPFTFFASCFAFQINDLEIWGALGFGLTFALAAGTYFFFAALTAPIQIAIMGGLAAAAFVITTIAVVIDCLRKNAEIKRKQEQANPKTKEDREKEITKNKEDKIQKTQKAANPKITNDVEKPLWGNLNEFFSDDEQTLTANEKSVDL